MIIKKVSYVLTVTLAVLTILPMKGIAAEVKREINSETEFKITKNQEFQVDILILGVILNRVRYLSSDLISIPFEKNCEEDIVEHDDKDSKGISLAKETFESKELAIKHAKKYAGDLLLKQIRYVMDYMNGNKHSSFSRLCCLCSVSPSEFLQFIAIEDKIKNNALESCPIVLQRVSHSSVCGLIKVIFSEVGRVCPDLIKAIFSKKLNFYTFKKINKESITNGCSSF